MEKEHMHITLRHIEFTKYEQNLLVQQTEVSLRFPFTSPSIALSTYFR
jgi:hypothetical protein